MNTNRKLVIILAVIALSSFLVTCKVLAGIAGVGLNVAAATGVVDQNTANRVNQSIQNAAEEITPEQEYYIGRAVAANLLTNYKLWNGSPALVSYLNKICGAITVNSPKPDVFNGYHVAILDTQEINAFATSGGHIFVSRGLINAASSEDALAGVIAHEVAHIQLQHSIKAIKNSRITNALLVTGAAAAQTAGAASGYDLRELTSVFSESVGEIVTTMVNNGYSQTQEFDADTTAMKLMAAAGYNPSGLVAMLRELARIQTGSSGGFNKTHPTPAQRITNAEKTVNTFRVTDTSSYRGSRFNAIR